MSVMRLCGDARRLCAAMRGYGCAAMPALRNGNVLPIRQNVHVYAEKRKIPLNVVNGNPTLQ